MHLGLPFRVDIKAATGVVLQKRLFLENTQHSQENTCVETLKSRATLLKRDSNIDVFL